MRGPGTEGGRRGIVGRARATPLVLAAALAALACPACEQNPFNSDELPPPPPPPTRPPGMMPAPSAGPDPGLVALDGGPYVERSDPPPLAGDLKSDVDSFTTIDACVTQHASLDPVVGDAVRAIGYDTLLRDACRVLMSIKMKDATLCAAISASGLQHRCEAMVAMATQDADKCPWAAAADKTAGREPTCLAVATHDPRICAADLSERQPTCEALTTGDPTRCLSNLEGDRRTCERDLARDKTLFVDRERQAHDPTKPRAHVELHGESDASIADADLSSLVVGGAVFSSLPAGGVGIELARDTESVLGLPSRTERSHLALSLALEDTGPRVTRLELTAPKMPSVSCPSPHCSLHATIAKGDATRGAPITTNVEGKVETPGATYTLHLVVESFVRDVVGRAAIYGSR